MSTVTQTIDDFTGFLPPARFTTEEYLAMVDAGLLEGKKVELIGGVIVQMSPAGIPHNYFLINLLSQFAPLLEKFEIAIQGTIPVIRSSVFDPDFMLLLRQPKKYKRAYPQPHDVQLVIEASASSLNRDKKYKLPIYAAAGIQEYWIADLDNEQILVHRNPVEEAYQSVQILKGDDRISPLAAPEFSLTVRQMFE